MELLYTWVGRSIHLGRLTYPEAVAVAFGGILLGNIIGYHIGQYGGRPLIYYLASVLDIPTERLKHFEKWFRSHGLLALFVVRWTGLGYAQLTWFCGMARVPLWRFVVVAAIADLLWATAWTFAGHQLTRWLHSVFKPEVFLTIGIIIAAIILYYLFRLYRHWRSIQQRLRLDHDATGVTQEQDSPKDDNQIF